MQLNEKMKDVTVIFLAPDSFQSRSICKVFVVFTRPPPPSSSSTFDMNAHTRLGILQYQILNYIEQKNSQSRGFIFELYFGFYEGFYSGFYILRVLFSQDSTQGSIDSGFYRLRVLQTPGFIYSGFYILRVLQSPGSVVSGFCRLRVLYTRGSINSLLRVLYTHYSGFCELRVL